MDKLNIFFCQSIESLLFNLELHNAANCSCYPGPLFQVVKTSSRLNLLFRRFYLAFSSRARELWIKQKLYLRFHWKMSRCARKWSAMGKFWRSEWIQIQTLICHPHLFSPWVLRVYWISVSVFVYFYICLFADRFVDGMILDVFLFLSDSVKLGLIKRYCIYKKNI